ncbi:MAG: aminopeptidase [Bacteroidaceae bacterium]|nr:aminopeptidase [Bacteroidaceae bacterium]
MKKTLFYSILLLVGLCLPLSVAAQTELQNKMKEIANITEVKALESEEFAEKYVTYFTQPIDHENPELGTFRQRVFVSHVGFDRPTVLVTEGYGASYAFNPKYREELSKWFNTNMIFVEYRYFLESTPEPRDWQYLTTKNSADDLHAIRNAFKQIYPGKWIATGISKGGQTTMLYRTFYPDDVDISVPYVAPLCYGVEDGRHEPFLRYKVGTAEERRTIENFQFEVLKRRATLQPLFDKHCAEKKYEFRAPLEEIYDYAVLEYPFALWQWGTPISTIPSLDASDEEIFKHFLAISDPSYFDVNGPYASFNVQACRELGYYGYDMRPFKDYMVIKSTKDYLRRLMLPEDAQFVKFDKTLGKKITKFLKKNDPKMIFIYGEIDPWSAAAVTWLNTNKKKNLHIFVEPRGSHKARISTLPEDMQKEAKALIQKWLDE